MLLPPLQGFAVDFVSFYPAYVVATVIAIFLPYLRWRGMWPMHAAVEVGVMMLIAPIAVVTLTYCGMRLNLPMADALLSRMDAVFGFSTIDAIRWINHFPTINWILCQAYLSFAMQTMLVGPAVAILIGPARGYLFVTGFIVLVVLSALIGMAFPSHGAIVGQGFDPRSFSYISEGAARGFIETFEAVRGGGDFVLSRTNVSGILTFPSDHAAMAVLCAWACWPSRLLRWPVLVLNVLMFFSSIVVGSHYIVDVIGGGMLAYVTILLITLPSWRIGGAPMCGRTEPREIGVGALPSRA